MWVAALQGRRTATLQVCDLYKQCAVRDLNPQPADYSQSNLALTVMSRLQAMTPDLLTNDDYGCLLFRSSKRALNGHRNQQGKEHIMTTTTTTEPTGADFKRSWESEPRTGAPDPSDPTDTRMVWGYCAPFCIGEGPTNGASVKDHGDHCESVRQSVEAHDAQGDEVSIFTGAAKAYFHGTVHRSLVYRDANDPKVELDILARGVEGDDVFREVKRFYMTASDARSLARHLCLFADVADGSTGNPNEALGKREAATLVV